MTESEQDTAANSPDEQPQVDAVQRAKRLENQTLWVDLQIRAAIERGEFDDLPGAGKPIPGLDAPHDPDWWVKGLIEREHITGVLPAALALRTENDVLEDVLDNEVTEGGVRRVLEDFNARIVDARRQLQGGPPVITPLRDVDEELAAWASRRAQRRTQRRESTSQPNGEARTPWLWRRRHHDNAAEG